jgi:hypothetical protein
MKRVAYSCAAIAVVLLGAAVMPRSGYRTMGEPMGGRACELRGGGVPYMDECVQGNGGCRGDMTAICSTSPAGTACLYCTDWATNWVCSPPDVDWMPCVAWRHTCSPQLSGICGGGACVNGTTRRGACGTRTATQCAG